jgi:hypothetical protein
MIQQTTWKLSRVGRLVSPLLGLRDGNAISVTGVDYFGRDGDAFLFDISAFQKGRRRDGQLKFTSESVDALEGAPARAVAKAIMAELDTQDLRNGFAFRVEPVVGSAEILTLVRIAGRVPLPRQE